MKNFFLTLDLEEWYHLEYLKKYPLKKEALCIPSLEGFFAFLEESKIRITVFVLGEIAEQFRGLIKTISDQGHEIACHGYRHELLYNMSLPGFKEETQQAKRLLEDITGKKVIGYRAPCFSMDRDKLDSLYEIGFRYDSSFIRFSQHSLYSDLDLTGYNKVGDLIYKHNCFYEFEIPTLRTLKYNIPISGGGYFRLIPYPLYIKLFKRYAQTTDNFVFYIHPFELGGNRIGLKDVSLKDRFRFTVGRRNNLDNVKRFLAFLRSTHYHFSTLEDMVAVYS